MNCLRIAVLLLAAAVLALPETADAASAKHAVERKSFTDAEIIRGFFKIALGAELRLRGRTDRIRKYDGPIRVYIDNRGEPDRSNEVVRVIADIRNRVANLDIAVTENHEEANFVVTLVRDRDLAKTIRAFFGRQARRIQASLQPQCLSGFRKDASYRIVRSTVILVVDAGDFIFRDCAYEEILQAMGPINDDSSVPWTMFNDNVQLGYFGLYDQYILNILYDPSIRPGMTRKQLKALLPQVLPRVRAWVAKVNGLGE